MSSLVVLATLITMATPIVPGANNYNWAASYEDAVVVPYNTSTNIVEFECREGHTFELIVQACQGTNCGLWSASKYKIVCGELQGDINHDCQVGTPDFALLIRKFGDKCE